ncbi:MAG: carboxypeptidase-like regulatory domain-containing protein [Polaribacter sp.]
MKSFFILILILQSSIAKSQDANFVKGKLISFKDKTPIPFATLRIKNKNKGLISNIDGGFKIPDKYQINGDTLIISSIGFSTKEIPLASFKKNTINTVILKEKIEALNEVIIISSKKNRKRKKSAVEIIKLAIRNIGKNYPFSKFSYIGYYRDYQINKEKYYNLNEAIMEVFDPGFAVNDFKGTDVRIYKYNKNLNFPIDTLSNKPYNSENKNKIIPNASLSSVGGNEFTILRIHDAFRNYNTISYDFVNRFDQNFINDHTFTLLPNTYINDVNLYTIKIRKTYNNFKVKGKIYISKADFKIYKMEYAVYNNKETSKFFDVKLEYQEFEDKMYPNYISFNNSFKVLQPPKFFLVDALLNNSNNPTLKFIFNNNLNIENRIKKNSFKIYYKNKRIKVNRIKVDKNEVVIFFDKEKVSDSDFAELNKVTYKIKNIKDIFGNKFNERKYLNYKQYREFFIQELKVNSYKPTDNLYMDKNKPIFYNQSIAPFNNLSNYWLNTPMKN